jgi:hypothetical protein
MSLHIRSAVACDDKQCAEVVVDDDRYARQVAKRQGWVRSRRGDRTLDLCPAHRQRSTAAVTEVVEEQRG